jgi:hypothetical protein
MRMSQTAVVVGMATITIAACGGSGTKTIVKTVHTPATTTQATTTQAASGPTTKTLPGGLVCTYASDGTLQGCTGGSTTTTSASASTSSGPPQCAATGFSGSECVASNGTTFKLAHGTGTLHLKSLDASVAGVRTADSLYDSAANSHVTPNGTFLIIALHVLNKSDSPAAFDGGGYQNQSLLQINGRTYQEDSHAEIFGDPQSPYGQDNSVSPGESVTYDLVFDVPPHVAGGVTSNRRTGLIIGNYGDDFSLSLPSTVGMITLKGA